MDDRDPFVFPYRLVLTYEDGSVATLDPSFAPLPFDGEASETVKLPGTPGNWVIERLEQESETVFTRSSFEADPTLRLGTAYLRQVERG